MVLTVYTSTTSVHSFQHSFNRLLNRRGAHILQRELKAMACTTNAFLQLVLSGQERKENNSDTTSFTTAETNCTATLTPNGATPTNVPCRAQGATPGEWSDAVLPAEAAFSYDTEEYSGWRLRAP